ncbi:uncharacterized protein B0P05DRAFT_562148 [Gilbertella persicaria]|uniref:uncharacterized protein n=1 Tax=Gilbertella persicaria TaxID=101096 RepID=UPI00221F5DB6|nr:uncharacterized protein B0P05DRAFT_562148 [Gilbertella persicaria]KAI8052607.1 hypothetical protein B0P05DRAFT_562148 [Gilbertella persicaria]
MASTMTPTESKYSSFMKPTKFWQKSTSSPAIPQHESPQETRNSYLPSLKFKKSKSTSTVIALEESGKSEVYKLSTIDHTGIYMPPSPGLSGKRDHWIEVNEDKMMDFHLPSSDCLTRHINEKHDFYTPSSFVNSQPYILPMPTNMSESTLSTVPSLEDDSHSDIISF